MLGLMQDRPLLISSLIDFAAQYHGDVEIVSRTIEGPIHRHSYADANTRSKQLAQALVGLGITLGDRVATLAWNGYRHLECYYGVSGIGAVLHTINPRLFPEQIVYIANHAEDRVLFTELTFVPLLEGIADQLQRVEAIVIMTDRAHMPETSLPNVLCYEELLVAQDGDFAWPSFNEKTASSLCYTSGTTGNPKGVLYSHRSTVLHSMASCSNDVLGLSSQDSVLPVVPMFHANSWGIAYSAPMSGAKLVLPGMGMDGASICELLEQEKVTLSAGVPTVWLMLLQYLQQNDKQLPYMTRTVIGGSAAPASMIETFEHDFDVVVIHAWGMTEMSPLGTTGNLKAGMADWDYADKLTVKSKQGRAVYGVDMKITDDDGNELPRDGVAFGHLMVRGPWITNGYFKGDGGEVLDTGDWFDTGDVATLDPEGYMQITDRSKDVIKSGGEWISSIDLENIAVGHPGVAEAAVIGVAHPKWDERPLLIIVRNEGSSIEGPEILDFMKGSIASWWMPDDVTFVDEIPHTATGKIQKLILREQFADYKLPTA
ncbi:MAG: 3-(methylthio)propionyl-CoA ligase [Alphaproteobacteria bacterium]|jgi:fatty-acyl-CoA synthase|nr:3-(methylthio)propionyl-CoA ligase [Alphaproteobacteria bacterium]MDP6255168.1 3-(methylthio)propionyl-CoA ligase [Alphaproteobacteria bacterium]MDP7052588.1 3-(methylthio)propionyl-CoA ligase [Alphaproteobacteria bacterium]MDP7229705.1 3-(methylthio)propionyl-CoA ligase [Alphaproteobacteria bacterium]MDP7458961.1 3-(methylthio)propionyl-CoA ligase [Alphaproteobacteria bacterium]|tara:strand:- start:9982 stop:11610 length:1629 start_codon:yes stop_codon:yes gene_type:complete